jgi:uncharacterized membrane-anchored protein
MEAMPIDGAAGAVRRDAAGSRIRQLLNKVPEVTVFFWVIKILCTTVGETGADNLNDKLGFGLTNTTLIMSALLVVALVFQFRLRRYLPVVYWGTVVLISIVGTLITDNLVENYGVSLPLSTTIFAIALLVTFAVWFTSEKTLSIHTIVTAKREALYWLTVLFTFALGTAAGDLVAEKLNVGYWNSALIFGGVIAAVFFAHRVFELNAILSFWIAYILTRPLGASLGDGFSQPRSVGGGLGLGTTTTSMIFLTAIVATVIYLTVTRRDRIEKDGDLTAEAASHANVLVVANKTAATPALIEAVRARAAVGPATFFLLVPNPDQIVFDRHSENIRLGEQVLALALPLLEEAAGAKVEGRVATSPNAYDDIAEELDAGDHEEIILSTLPSHVSHWLHVDLPNRVAQLGYPLTTVTPRLRTAGRRPTIASLPSPSTAPATRG